MKTVPALGTSVSRPIDSLTARVAQTLSALLPRISPVASERNARPVSLQLARGEVHRIDQADGFSELHVLDGDIWLTTTPADGDIHLREADQFSLSAACPIVIEALKDASVLLVHPRDCNAG